MHPLQVQLFLANSEISNFTKIASHTKDTRLNSVAFFKLFVELMDMACARPLTKTLPKEKNPVLYTLHAACIMY